MHEISLVRSIFQALDGQFEPQERGRVRSIRLKIGPLANVEPLLLQSAFDAVREAGESPYAAARLDLEQVPIIVRCDACEKDSEVQQYRFVCAHCGKPSAQVVQGNELLIAQVELSEE
jgi:hydrogenase nickel incorporation protein HypA/HybF